ncbi:hypothetical protein PPL_00447 [Heterostelium album PN500]|uniref:E2 ubiquitin-conjugating enzyme n=1 Tax=Heterostelium pallidum (strain ATCC 26659 / Pp 5 / PN500) TaxID=670386 RepID=D3AWH3_HETP5|nr:hypothetical protein PPL_00447 [Heterostelium album PN500]EFA86646.1 hypothetical protein PPL_00447 [Heterostelium album PN500]|eukprot:XP_020438751.1 hypothetical protein PPL_00447 [Heterostelium album PN500]
MSELPQALLSRLKYELNLFEKDPPPGIQAWIAADKVDHLEASIIGPESTPYHKGVFKLEIIMPMRYPFEPPKVKFITPIYHPNVDNQGRICLDTLNMPPKGVWAPSLNLLTVLSTIRLLMSEPNPYDPLMQDITDEFKNNHPQFLRTAEQWTKKYAKEDEEGKVTSKEKNDNSTTTSTSSTTTTTTTSNNNNNSSSTSSNVNKYNGKRERENDLDKDNDHPTKVNRNQQEKVIIKDDEKEEEEEEENDQSINKENEKEDKVEEDDDEDENDGW